MTKLTDAKIQHYAAGTAMLLTAVRQVCQADLNGLASVAGQILEAGEGPNKNHAMLTKRAVALVQLFKADMQQLKMEAIEDHPSPTVSMLP